MATVTDKISDARAREIVYLLRYSKRLARQQANLVDSSIAELLAKVNMRATKAGTLTEARYLAILKDLIGINKELYAGILSDTTDNLKDLAAFESTSAALAISAAYPIEMVVNKVSPSQIHAAALARPFQGKFLKEWYQGQSASARDQYRQAIRMGFIEGETTSQISRRIREIGEMERRHAETIARTAVNHTANVAMRETSLANSDILSGEEWVSVLDGRTSAICKSRDGNVYPLGKGPYPPAHPNCRSARVPKTKSWKELGFDSLKDEDRLSTRPFVADKRRVKDIPKKDRDSITGQTTEKTYNDWLRTQPKSFVEDTLGKTKAKLYLDGGLSLNRFVDRNGRELSLNDIASREWGEGAFKQAGIELP